MTQKRMRIKGSGTYACSPFSKEKSLCTDWEWVKHMHYVLPNIFDFWRTAFSGTSLKKSAYLWIWEKNRVDPTAKVIIERLWQQPHILLKIFRKNPTLWKTYQSTSHTSKGYEIPVLFGQLRSQAKDEMNSIVSRKKLFFSLDLSEKYYVFIYQLNLTNRDEIHAYEIQGETIVHVSIICKM